MSDWDYAITDHDLSIEFGSEGVTIATLRIKYEVESSDPAIQFTGYIEKDFFSNEVDLTGGTIDIEGLQKDIHKAIQNTIDKVWTKRRMQVFAHDLESRVLADVYGKTFKHSPSVRDKTAAGDSRPFGFHADVPKVKDDLLT